MPAAGVHSQALRKDIVRNKLIGERMLTIYDKIDRTARLVRWFEEDAPLLNIRVANLTAERQQATKEFASRLAESARAELERLVQQSVLWDPNDHTPQPAD